MTVSPLVNLDPNLNQRIPAQKLDQFDFFKLIITELKNQDPFANKDTAKLLESFLSLGNFQAMQDMKKSVEDVSSNVSMFFSQQQIILAQALVGDEVEIKANEVDQPNITGIVSAYRISNGEIFVTVNGEEYPSADIITIKTSEPPSPPEP